MRSPGDLESVPGDGFSIGISHRPRAAMTKDRGAEQFWAQLVDITAVGKEKASHSHWGAKKCLAKLPGIEPSPRRIKTVLETFFYSEADADLFYCSSEVSVPHRRCLSKDQLIEGLLGTHDRDHRQWETCYEALRTWPVLSGRPRHSRVAFQAKRPLCSVL